MATFFVADCEGGCLPPSRSPRVFFIVVFFVGSFLFRSVAVCGLLFFLVFRGGFATVLPAACTGFVRCAAALCSVFARLVLHRWVLGSFCCGVRFSGTWSVRP